MSLWDFHVCRKEEPAEQKTEAQLMIEAKMKKHENEEDERIREIEEQRRVQKQKEDEELAKLKEKQVSLRDSSANSLKIAIVRWRFYFLLIPLVTLSYFRPAASVSGKRRTGVWRSRKKCWKNKSARKMYVPFRSVAKGWRHSPLVWSDAFVLWIQEDRRIKVEEEKKRKQEEAERKKAAAQAAMAGGRNFVIDKEKTGGESTIDKVDKLNDRHRQLAETTGKTKRVQKYRQ